MGLQSLGTAAQQAIQGILQGLQMRRQHQDEQTRLDAAATFRRQQYADQRADRDRLYELERIKLDAMMRPKPTSPPPPPMSLGVLASLRQMYPDITFPDNISEGDADLLLKAYEQQRKGIPPPLKPGDLTAGQALGVAPIAPMGSTLPAPTQLPRPTGPVVQGPLTAPTLTVPPPNFNKGRVLPAPIQPPAPQFSSGMADGDAPPPPPLAPGSSPVPPGQISRNGQPFTGMTGTPYALPPDIDGRILGMARSNDITVDQALRVYELVNNVAKARQGETTAPLIIGVDPSGVPKLLRDDQNNIVTVPQSVQSSLQSAITTMTGREVKPPAPSRDWMTWLTTNFAPSGEFTPGSLKNARKFLSEAKRKYGWRGDDVQAALKYIDSMDDTLFTREMERKKFAQAQHKLNLDRQQYQLSREKFSQQIEEAQKAGQPDIAKVLTRMAYLRDKFYRPVKRNDKISTEWVDAAAKREYDALHREANEMQYQAKVQEARAAAKEYSIEPGTPAFDAFMKELGLR